MKDIDKEDIITIGNFVVVQKVNYKKIYKVAENAKFVLGKDPIKMGEIVGKPFGTTFKLIPPPDKNLLKHGKKKPSTLVVAEKCESLKDLKDAIASGYDNRLIYDDGKSQKLSKDDILSLRDAGKSGREIVSSLIENNASFTEKTEYSQEKYIRKKEKKYCEFLSIHKTTVPLIQEIYLKQDAAKIYGLRMDTLAQIYSYSDIKSDGTFILYDSGSGGLIPSGLLSRMGSNSSANLVYLHPGDHLPQIPIMKFMNFSEKELEKLTIVSIFDFLKSYYNKGLIENVNSVNIKLEEGNIDKKSIVDDNKSSVDSKIVSEEKQCVKDSEIDCNKLDNELDKVSTNEQKSIVDIENSKSNNESDYEENKCKAENVDKVDKVDINMEEELVCKPKIIAEIDQSENNKHDCNENQSEAKNTLKRKNEEISQDGPPLKKSKRILAIEFAVNLLSETKADSLIVIAREHPLNIVKELLLLVKSSRPFVIYHAHREPLQETYVALKQHSSIANLRLFSNFLRSYQVLTERTHPDISMNDCGGYILTGYTVDFIKNVQT